jgi:ectoine hydroxylase-related dioxygenase (phytanoyl-CoA dioxygenase family)
MLTSDQVAKFARDGFLNGGPALSDAEVDVLRDELARVLEHRETLTQRPVLLRNIGGEQSPVWQIVNIWEASAAYRDLIGNQKITAEIAQLTGATELRIWHDQIQYKPAATGGVNMWHQDAPLWPILTPMTEVSAWVALDDVDIENGCMSMVPGSHLWGDNIKELEKLPGYDALPAKFAGHPIEIVPRPVRRGEVHYHHALTWHGSHANNSTRPRRAIALHFMTHETRYRAAGEHCMKPYVEVADGEPITGAHFPLVYAA